MIDAARELFAHDEFERVSTKRNAELAGVNPAMIHYHFNGKTGLLEAAFQENIPIVVLVDNNGGLDCISQQQERLFESGQHFATDFRDIPFHGLFEGLGGYGELVESEDQLVPALRRAIASGKPACLNVAIESHPAPTVRR